MKMRRGYEGVGAGCIMRRQSTKRCPVMKFRAAAAVLLLFSSNSFAGEFEAGVDASARGDYQTALRLWRPLADAGHVDAQFNIGLLYDNGAGVDRDPALAAEWYRRAAQAGDAVAQS